MSKSLQTNKVKTCETYYWCMSPCKIINKYEEKTQTERFQNL